MTQPNVLELAKQGDPQAIAALMNHHLQSQGVTAETRLEKNCLMVFLQAEQVPEQEHFIEFVRRGLTSLRAKSIEKVKLYGRQTSFEAVAWSHEFELTTQVHPTTLPTQTPSDPLQNITKTRKLNTKPSSCKSQSNSFGPSFYAEQLFNVISTAKNNIKYHPFQLSCKHKYIAGPIAISMICITVLTTRMLFSSNPSKTVDAFLSTLNKGDEQTALKYWCFQSGSSLYAVRSWKIVNQEQKNFEVKPDNLTILFPQIGNKLEGLSNQEYTQVIVRVDSSTKAGIPITNDWRFSVWKTQRISDSSERVQEVSNIIKQNIPVTDSTDDLSQLEKNINLTATQTKFLLSTISLTGDKGKLTSEHYCITSIEEQ